MPTLNHTTITFVNSLIHLLSRSLVRLDIHPLTNPHTNSITHPHSITYSQSQIHSLIFTIAHLFINSINHSPTNSIIHRHSNTHSHSAFLSPTLSDVHLLINSFTQSRATSMTQPHCHTYALIFDNLLTLFTHQFTHPLHRLPTNSLARPASHTQTRCYLLTHTRTLVPYKLTG
jgi:hypothetical protein